MHSFFERCKGLIKYFVTGIILFGIFWFSNWLIIGPILNWLLPDNEFILKLIPLGLPLALTFALLEFIYGKAKPSFGNNQADDDETK